MRFIKPQKAKSVDKQKNWSWESSNKGYIAEEKFDGHRISVIRDGASVKVLSALGKPKKIAWLEFMAAALPQGTYLDGEIHSKVEGHISSDVGHLLAHRPEELQVTFFDVLAYQGIDVTGDPFHTRRDLLTKTLLNMYELLTSSGHPDTGGRVNLSSIYTANFKNEFDRIVDKKGEGLMLKRLDSVYKAGSRCADWLKIKAVDDVDVVIVDCKGTPSEWRVRPGAMGEPDPERPTEWQEVEGSDRKVLWPKGRHTDPWEKGYVNLRYGYYDLNGVLRMIGPTGICGPEEEMCKHVGKVAKFKIYGDLLSTGAMRHPVFIEYRDDKLPEECIFKGFTTNYN